MHPESSHCLHLLWGTLTKMMQKSVMVRRIEWSGKVCREIFSQAQHWHGPGGLVGMANLEFGLPSHPSDLGTLIEPKSNSLSLVLHLLVKLDQLPQPQRCSLSLSMKGLGPA